MNKKRRPMLYLEYFLRHLCVSAWICFMYYSLLFVSIPGYTVNASKAIFFIGNQVIWFVLSVFTSAKRRNKYNALFNVVLSYIPYFLITYFPLYKRFITPFIVIAVALSTLYFVSVVFKKTNRKHNFKRVIRHRAKYAANGIRIIAGVMALILLASAYCCTLFGVKLIKSDTPLLKSANAEEAEQWTIKNNLDTVKLLQKKEWEGLSVDKKIDVLSTIRNIEVVYLGLSHEVYLTVKPTNEDVLGYYDHKEHTVVISDELISSEDVEECLSTLCHEMYHAYEHNQVEAYQSVDERYRNMYMFSAARDYEEEFANYISGEDDFFGYILQDSEIDADRYAESAVKDYYQKITLYMNEEKQTKAA